MLFIDAITDRPLTSLARPTSLLPPYLQQPAVGTLVKYNGESVGRVAKYDEKRETVTLAIEDDKRHLFKDLLG